MEIFSNLKRSKIYRPLLVDNYIRRQDLIDQLNEYSQHQATLICAPAGYGKSTLVNYWLDTIRHPVAWVSLDKSDNDIRQFLIYMLSSLRSSFEKVNADAFMVTMEMVKAITVPSISTLVNSFRAELNRTEQPVTLVLDDFQFITNDSVLKLIYQLLSHPAQKLHLVLVCRRDPPLPIYKLRAGNLLTEIRTQDLRFKEKEIKLFVEQELGIEIDSSVIAILGEKTEGWVTGLRLAIISMRHRGGELDPKLLEPQVDAKYVMEYLFTEVFSRQPMEFRKKLMDMAILDRFCGPLCETICLSTNEPPTGEVDGWAIVAKLQSENLFLISLDAENQWFRFHHLFQKLLLGQLRRHSTSGNISTLHLQASAWFAENGMIEDALKHSFAGGDNETAVELIEQYGHVLMDSQDWQSLERWIGMLPSDHVEQNPTLLMYLAWHNHIKFSGHDLTTMATYLDKVQKLLNTLSPKESSQTTSIWGHYGALRGFQALIFAEGERGLQQLQSACEKIPNHQKRARVFACVFRTAAYQMVGELETGLSMYNDEMAKDIRLGSNYHAIYLMNLCHIYWINADLKSIKVTAEHSLKALVGQQMPETTASALYFLGVTCYHQNDLKIAEEKLTQLVNNFYFINVIRSTHGAIALALVYLAMGEIDRMDETIQMAMGNAVDVNNQAAIKIIKAFEAEFALRHGRIAEASEWAKQFKVKPIMLPFLFYWPQLTLIKVLLAQDTTESLLQAGHLLDQFADYLASIHNKRFMIDTLALQALIDKKRGNMVAAREKLHTALTLAESGGFVRCFNNLGPLMPNMLRQELSHNNSNLKYVGRLLAVFAEDDHKTAPHGSDNISMSSQVLTKPLTNRELDVLNLLANRLQNKDIADKLSISPETVKSHLKIIFKKLGVTNRQNAVYKAATFGILSAK